MGDPSEFTALKLQALDAACRNPTVSDRDFRTLYAIASAIDRRTGKAIRPRDKLAEAAACSIRCLEVGTARLEAKGLVRVERGGGRGWANTYSIVTKMAHTPSPIAPPKRASDGVKRANDGAENSEQIDQKGRTAVRPIPYIPKSSLEPTASSAHQPQWLLIEQLLRTRFGNDVMVSWFGKAGLVGVADGIVTIGLPTKFVCQYVDSHFAAQLRVAVQAVYPAAQIIRCIVTSDAAVQDGLATSDRLVLSRQVRPIGAASVAPVTEGRAVDPGGSAARQGEHRPTADREDSA